MSDAKDQPTITAEFLAVLSNLGRGWASHAHFTDVPEDFIAATRVLRALTEALQSQDREALREMGNAGKSYLERQRKKAMKNGGPAWRFMDPMNDRDDDADEVLAEMKEYLANYDRKVQRGMNEGTACDELARAFLGSAAYDFNRGTLRALLRPLVPQWMHSPGIEETVRSVADAFAGLLMREDRAKSRDVEAYVRAGLVALGYDKQKAKDFYKHRRRKEDRRGEQSRNCSPAL